MERITVSKYVFSFGEAWGEGYFWGDRDGTPQPPLSGHPARQHSLRSHARRVWLQVPQTEQGTRGKSMPRGTCMLVGETGDKMT